MLLRIGAGTLPRDVLEPSLSVPPGCRTTGACWHRAAGMIWYKGNGEAAWYWDLSYWQLSIRGRAPAEVKVNMSACFTHHSQAQLLHIQKDALFPAPREDFLVLQPGVRLSACFKQTTGDSWRNKQLGNSSESNLNSVSYLATDGEVKEGASCFMSHLLSPLALPYQSFPMHIILLLPCLVSDITSSLLTGKHSPP